MYILQHPDDVLLQYRLAYKYGKTPLQLLFCPLAYKQMIWLGYFSKVCTISFERPVNYLCHPWHVFPAKYEAWTHFNRPWTEYMYQCQGVVWRLLIIFTESVNRSTCLSVYLIITRLRNVNLLCFSDSIEGIDFLNCTLKCSVTLKLANQNRYFY